MIKASSSQKQILLVDDDKSITDILTMLLETRGYHVTVAHSGREALELVSSAIDVILLDLVLPDLEGFHVCRQLKERPHTCNIAIIVLTGKAFKQDVVESLHLGADDCMMKPVESEELIARMEAVMRRKADVFRPGGPNGEIAEILELRRIMDGGCITPFFQPIFMVDPLSLYGFESLSRPMALSPLDTPDVLFKVALKYGFYQDMELLAWKKTLDHASGRLNGKKLFLNCNPYLLEGPKFTEVQSLFDEHCIDKQDVILEITERSAISDFDLFYQHLRKYRDQGFRFAVDDVGGGYASLESIVEIRPEILKIDRHIINQIVQDPFRRSIVQCIASFCKEHGVLSVAEGIETKQDFDAVRALGIQAGQGYYFSRPQPEILPEDVLLKNLKS